MTEKIDQQREKLQRDWDRALVVAVEFELLGSVAHAGGVLSGLSVKYSQTDCLMTLRAVLPSGPCVAFVGGATLADCFRRAVNDAYQDNLKWRADEYAR